MSAISAGMQPWPGAAGERRAAGELPRTRTATAEALRAAHPQQDPGTYLEDGSSGVGRWPSNLAGATPTHAEIRQTCRAP